MSGADNPAPSVRLVELFRSAAHPWALRASGATKCTRVNSTVPLCEPHQPPPREFAPRRRDCDKVNGVATFALNESAHR